MSASGADRVARSERAGSAREAAIFGAAVAFEDVRALVESLAGELANFRQRALRAETELRRAHGGMDVPLPALAGTTDRAEPAPGGVGELERENAELRRRLEFARGRTERLIAQLRFVRQQHEGSVR